MAYHISDEYKYSPHFFTITVSEWIDLFTKPWYCDLITDSFIYCRKNKGLLVYEFVIMTNHLHFIASAEGGSDGITAIVRDFKRHTQKQLKWLIKKDNRAYLDRLFHYSIKKHTGNELQIWQRGSHGKLIQSSEMYDQKARYIWNNPVKKNYVREPQDWVYSSARQRLLGDDAGSIIFKCDSLAG